MAIRPTVLFVAAFALNITPHEAVHAVAAYLLGFSSTLFQMWVNPDAAAATPSQLGAIAVAGPIFGLALGVICWVLYKGGYKQEPSGLSFLMFAIIGIYAFFGPVAAAAFGGDFHTPLRAVGAPKMLENAVSAVGLILLPTFMFFTGKELSRWAPRSFGKVKAVVCTTVCALVGGNTPGRARLLAVTRVSRRFYLRWFGFARLQELASAFRKHGLRIQLRL